MKAMLTATVMLLFSVMSVTPGHAHSYELGDLLIVHPWAKPSLKGVPNGAAYMAISNSSDDDDVLVSVSSSVAENVELHTMEITGGVMRMRPIEGGIKLPAHDTVLLEPGGKHIMLIGLKGPLAPGSRFDLTLTFEKAGEHSIEGMVLESAPNAVKDGS